MGEYAMKLAEIATSGTTDTLRAQPSFPAACKATVPEPVMLGPAQLPARNVSFCNAALYCAASGKRLCGSIQNRGGEVAFSSDKAALFMDHEWYAACTANNSRIVPWEPLGDAGGVGSGPSGPMQDREGSAPIRRAATRTASSTRSATSRSGSRSGATRPTEDPATRG